MKIKNPKIIGNILQKMAKTKKAVEIGLSLRNEAGTKVRQPLSKLEINIDDIKLKVKKQQQTYDKLVSLGYPINPGVWDSAVELMGGDAEKFIIENSRKYFGFGV